MFRTLVGAKHGAANQQIKPGKRGESLRVGGGCKGLGMNID